MQPKSGTTVGRPDLGAIAYEYLLEASQRGFIGLEIFPIFDVTEQSAQYPIIPLEALLKVPDTSRAPRGAYNRGDWEFEMGNYACRENGWEEPVDDSEANLYRRYFDAEEVATRRAVDILLRSQEIRCAGKAFSTAALPDSAVGVAWSTAATATPRADVSTAKTNMRNSSGLEPNVIAMSKATFDALLLTKEIMDVFRYTNPIEIGGFEAQRRIMAMYFGVDRILVGNAIRDTAKKGKDAVIADIWNKNVVGLFTVGGGPDLRQPVLGRTFLWTAESPQNLTTESYREEKRRSNIYRVRQHTDEAYVFTGAGYLLTGVNP
ncbi:MAG: major capsid protein [bacterium]|jgi:hypothetical protein